MDQNLELGRYTDEELLEVADGDVHGGTTWACATVTLVSAMTCPTTSCTDRC
ncbi:class II lanthipeptide, LchA2/BrtA2 family [Luteipulveratus sp. YIM 133132]|uniref:class II lanthipeptide, LchA2/BrtA2 family n=1 Tax=Luteipulveratus flavus TaxID=3031728 RepID=UPI0023B1A082|nr:class II lanthipeptide, LchA2/BrtA2 family [Luteipulveratus sp. YIM 133132]MDE9364928.1 class II lanthipeptide, LchA2/BrtA2 family [Luteipulveratus sp. YIM 133132]